MKKIWQLIIFLLATLSFVIVAFWWECDRYCNEVQPKYLLYHECEEDLEDYCGDECENTLDSNCRIDCIRRLCPEYDDRQDSVWACRSCRSVEATLTNLINECPELWGITYYNYEDVDNVSCCRKRGRSPRCENESNWDAEWQVDSEWDWAQTETSPTPEAPVTSSETPTPATPDTNWGTQETTQQSTQCEQTVTCNTWAWEMPDPTNPCKCVCNPNVKCCGVQLNTVVPFIWDCIELDADSSRGDTTSVNSMTAFPILMQWLMKILMSVIMVFSFIMVIVSWLMMTTWAFWKSSGFDKWKTILKNVIISFILLWCSWLILSLINPSFFK